MWGISSLADELLASQEWPCSWKYFSFWYLMFPDILRLWARSGDRCSTVVKVLCYKSEGHWFDPSFRSHCTPGVDSASKRNEYQAFPGGKGGRYVRLTTLPPSCAVVTKSGNLNFLEPSGPVQACNETALPFMSEVPRLLRVVLLVETTLRWGWAEWYWQEKAEVFGEKPFLVSLCLLQILHWPA